jgi:imidazolonepropionase-like amidohydrolase
MEDRGFLKEGMRADLFMVKGNPTVTIGDAMNITRVWRGGVKLE